MKGYLGAVVTVAVLAVACSSSGTEDSPSSPGLGATTATVTTNIAGSVVEPPYQEREVRFDHPSGAFSLAGTLTVPTGVGPFPGVVLISGSGSQDRNETIGKNQPFLVLADGLARQGIAVLRFDDRGAGKSEGDPVELSGATTSELAEDARAAVEFLASQPELAAGRIGVVGHSEGALIGPIVAGRSEAVAFAVLLAGSGVPGADVLERQTADTLRAEGASSEITDWAVGWTQELIEIAASDKSATIAESAMRQIAETAVATAPPGAIEGDPAQGIEANITAFLDPWMRFFLAYDPAPALRELQAPVLAILGGLDVQVSAEVNAPAIEAALEQNPNATVIVLAGLNHLFQPAKTGAISEYESLNETFAVEALDVIATWIHNNIEI